MRYAHLKETSGIRIELVPTPKNLPPESEIILFGKINHAHGEYVLLLKQNENERLFIGLERDEMRELSSNFILGPHRDCRIYKIGNRFLHYYFHQPRKATVSSAVFDLIIPANT